MHADAVEKWFSYSYKEVDSGEITYLECMLKVPVGEFAVGSKFSLITLDLTFDTIKFENVNELLDGDEAYTVAEFALEIVIGPRITEEFRVAEPI